MEIFILAREEDYHGYSQIDGEYFTSESDATSECKKRNKSMPKHSDKWEVINLSPKNNSTLKP